MSEFDKTLTTAQFNAYYTPKKAELSGYDAKYNAELNNVKQKEPPVVMNINKRTNELNAAKNNINNLNRQKSSLEQARGRAEQQRNTAASRANSGNFFTRMFNKRTFGPLVSRFQNEVNNINSRIPPIQNKINTLSATIPALNANLQTANTAKSNLETEANNIRNKINPVKAAQVTLITQKEYYDNREKACRDGKEVIESQKNKLTQYEAELIRLKKQHNTCIRNYDRKCSTKQHDKLKQLIIGRENEEDMLDEKQTEYNNDCKDKIQDCAPLFSVFQEKKAIYDDETNKKNKLDNEYKICIDQTKNDCKDIYKDANYQKSVTNTNIDMIKPSSSKSSEGFTQYSSTDNADATHAKIVANYKSVQNDYAKLTQHTRELNNANNNDIGKTSRYATKKQLYDNAIYTNILLTALATSMVFYIFIDI
jgi:chromosome segregation ATPase